ncbi:hypothetical protein HFK18_12560|uniref:hypothetical protein n=1 Tax=Stenotrophomonas sp. SbOxS2 TaxID=2723885 RepID=UPI0015D151B2|nr:hypothetical protein [Stenotrophomonas sp. SbOxS2]NYT99317.1 hypothetical protein [Stenotrophomonas sp. SbOxS2]
MSILNPLGYGWEPENGQGPESSTAGVVVNGPEGLVAGWGKARPEAHPPACQRPIAGGASLSSQRFQRISALSAAIAVRVNHGMWVCAAPKIGRAGGHKNEWIHQSKYYRTDRVRATLNCSLTPNNFTLTLEINKDGHTVLKEIILESLPDEIIFAHQLGSLERSEDTIIVRQKGGANLYRSTSI